jgi:hypothetical protein
MRLPIYRSAVVGSKISARHTGRRLCPHCGSDRLRNKGRYQHRVRHEDWGLRVCSGWRRASFNARVAVDISASGFQGSNPVNDPVRPFRE